MEGGIPAIVRAEVMADRIIKTKFQYDKIPAFAGMTVGARIEVKLILYFDFTTCPHKKRLLVIQQPFSFILILEFRF